MINKTLHLFIGKYFELFLRSILGIYGTLYKPTFSKFFTLFEYSKWIGWRMVTMLKVFITFIIGGIQNQLFWMLHNKKVHKTFLFYWFSSNSHCLSVFLSFLAFFYTIIFFVSSSQQNFFSSFLFKNINDKWQLWGIILNQNFLFNLFIQAVLCLFKMHFKICYLTS